MDEEPRTSGPEVTGAADEPAEPEQIRREIEKTREDLGETVEALAQKADVKGQAQDKVSEVRESLTGRKDELASKLRDAGPESFDPDRAAAVARENKLPLAVGGALVAGFLLGRLTSR